MANSDLINKEYKLPSNIIKTLESKKELDSEGNKRINNWLESGVATYQQLKRFKNDIENNYDKSEWGDVLRWLNSILNLDRGSIYRSKKVKSDIGLDNMFRKSHFKDSNSMNALKIPRLTEEIDNNIPLKYGKNYLNTLDVNKKYIPKDIFNVYKKGFFDGTEYQIKFGKKEKIYVPDDRNSDEMGVLYLQGLGADINSKIGEYKHNALVKAYIEGFEDGIYYQKSISQKINETMDNKKIIRLTESELIQLIENKINESTKINETVMQPTWNRISKLQNQIGKDELFDNLIRVLDDQIVNNALDYIERQFR